MIVEQQAKPALTAEQRRVRRWRFTVLLIILALSTTLGILHQLLPFGKAPVGVDALCPFGGIEAAFTLITTGKLLQRIALSSFILLAAVLVTAVLFRRAFCGYICPLGTLQEIMARLGGRLFKRPLRVPAAIDRPARGIKYLVFFLMVVGSARTAELAIRPYDPWVAYHHLTSSEVWIEFPWGLTVLGLTLVGSLLYNRVFYKYACPMGALLAMISWVGQTRVQRHAETCINCRRCDRTCPVGIDVSKQGVITSPECLDCHECVNVCPTAGTLVVAKRRNGIIAPRTALFAVVAMFTVTVGVTTALRLFQWTTIPLSAQTTAAGDFDPNAIRGKMVFADVIAVSGVPEATVMEHFGLTREELQMPIKDVGPRHGFEADDVRDFFLEQRTPAVAPDQAPPSRASAPTEPPSITGKMTLEEVAAKTGIPLATLAAHFKVDEADFALPLKQLAEQYPFTTQDVRDFVTAYTP
jgi:polyferredoxin